MTDLIEPKGPVGIPIVAEQTPIESPRAPLIAVEIVSRGEPMLRAVLDSLRQQTFKRFEVIVVWNGAGESVPPIVLPEGSVKVVPVSKSMCLLEARYIAHRASTAPFALILDSTRPLHPDCLATLARCDFMQDMMIINEESVTKNGRWAKLGELDKQVTANPRNLELSLNLRRRFVLPRYFRSALLTNALVEIERRAGAEKFRRIRYPDHHLIFGECLRLGGRVDFIPQALISHFEDSTPRETATKYHSHGKGAREFEEVSDFEYAKGLTRSARDLRGVPFRVRIQLFPLYGIRLASFLWGYYVPWPRNPRY